MNQHRVSSSGVVWVCLAVSLAIGCREENAGEALDTATFDRGASSSVEVLEALAVSDALFAFDPTLDPRMSAEANAMAIAAHVEAGMDGCASAEVTGTSVTVSFASGCVLRTGLTAAGSVSVVVGRTGANLDVDVTFDALALGSHALDGTASFRTTDGSTLDVVLLLTGASGSVSTDLTVVGTSGAMEIDGTATVTREGTTTTLAFGSIVWALGDCYPSSGSMTVSSGRVSQSVAFTSATPSTGTVSITQGRTTRDATLPSYGTCPMGA